MKKLLLTILFFLPLTAHAQLSLGNGLVGYWPFDARDTTSTVTVDRSGNNNNGTLIQGPSKVAGKIGQGLIFDGINAKITVPSSSVFDFANDFTVTAWYKTNTTQDCTVVGRAVGNLTQLWRIQQRISTLGASFEYAPSGQDYKAFTNSAFPLGSWQFLTARLSGTSATIWINGVASTPVTTTGITALSGNKLVIGDIVPANNNVCGGIIDDVRIYNRALSVAEIQQLYREGSGVHQNSFIDSLMNFIGI